MTVREVGPWREVTLTCGIGHTYRGRVRLIQRQSYDMDGDPLWQSASQQYDPDTCVVCGLKTWKASPSQG